MGEKWKFFIVEVTYRIPVEQIGDVLNEHRAYLQIGYDQGWLLMSGPQIPKTGGVIIARAPSRRELEEFFSKDPYQAKGIGDYRFIEFDPVKRQDFIVSWIEE